MNSIIIATILAAQVIALPTPSRAASEVSYFEIARQAIFNCPTYKNNIMQIKPTLVFDLIGIERKYNVPKSLRGILLATACQEKSLSGKIVPLRYWKVKVDSKFTPTTTSRFVYQKNADIWMTKIVDKLPLIKKRCAKLNETDRWKAAWDRGFGCNKKPQGFKLLRNWHTNIKKQKKSADRKKEHACDC